MSKATIIIVLTAVLTATANADTFNQISLFHQSPEALLNADNSVQTIPGNVDLVMPGQNVPGKAYPMPYTPKVPDCVFPIPEPKRDVTPQDFIGLPLQDAKNLANANGLKYRVQRIDGQYFMGTADYLPQRLNFEVDNGCVTKCTRG